jgi:hypothetical protein
MTDVYDRTRDPRDLTDYANAQREPNPPTPAGHALVRPTQGLAERIVGAQQVAVHRDEAKVLTKLTALAAAAGDDWFYRFPVKDNQTGQTKYIEGPSIKLANSVARIYGNNTTEIRVLDVGDAWEIYARFSDIETGFSMERAFRQRKGQRSIRGRDADRQLDIAYAIGQSKAIRNVIVNGLQEIADFAFEEAKKSIVTKIGKDLEGWRTRTIEGIAKIPVDLNRVERVIGRPAKDWLAPHVAQVIAMMHSIADGMADKDEMFPSLEAPEAPAPSGGEPAGQQGAEASRASTTDQPAATPSSETDLRLAWQRGKEAKAGNQKRAVPREFYAAHRTREAVCWSAGYDGQDLPTFKDET